MRTTLVIRDEVFVSAKKLAAEKGCSLSAVVNEALQRLVNRPGDDRKGQSEFRMPIFRGKGNAIDSQPVEFRELEEADLVAPFQE